MEGGLYNTRMQRCLTEIVVSLGIPGIQDTTISGTWIYNLCHRSDLREELRLQ